jgi:dihydroneopterin aldolase
MSDRITIKGIEGFGFHGVFDFEKRDGQKFYVDLEIEVDLTTASRTDALADTLDYGIFTTIAREEIEGEAVDLIERLAGKIADRIKAEAPTIESIAVTVHKPQAPVSETVADIAVTIRR